jgi:hypothetical protein
MDPMNSSALPSERSERPALCCFLIGAKAVWQGGFPGSDRLAWMDAANM